MKQHAQVLLWIQRGSYLPWCLGSPGRGRSPPYEGASSLSLDGTSFSAIMLLSKSKWNPHKHCLIRRTNQTNSSSLFYVCCIKCWYWKFIFILMFSYDVGVPLQRSVYDSYSTYRMIKIKFCFWYAASLKKWKRNGTDLNFVQSYAQPEIIQLECDIPKNLYFTIYTLQPSMNLKSYYYLLPTLKLMAVRDDVWIC